MPNFNKDILIQNIKNLMKTNNVSQPKLAADLNVGQPSISKCLNGKQSISIDLAYSIAEYFHVSLDELCRDPDTVETPKTLSPLPLSSKDEFIKVCEGLAEVFKYAPLKTKEIELREVVFIEEITEDGIETGMHYQAKDQFNMDPVNKYISLFFPNHHEIATTFSSYAEAAEYQAELRDIGNTIDRNVKINQFFKQLADLHSIYQNDSITKEAYFHAIDSNLDKIRE